MTVSWQPPTVLEGQLVAATLRGDLEGYLRILAGVPTFVVVDRKQADAVVAGRSDLFVLREGKRGGRSQVDVHPK